MNMSLSDHVENVGLQLTTHNRNLSTAREKGFSFTNDAGFQFDLSPYIFDGYLYKAEQEAIVSGFDGTYRGQQALIIFYVGTFALYHYTGLKLLLDRFKLIR